MVFIRTLAIMALAFFKRLSSMEEVLITIILSIVAAILIIKKWPKRQKTKDDDQKWQLSINEGEDGHSILRSNVEELSSNVEELIPNLAGIKYYDFVKHLDLSNSDSGIDSPSSKLQSLSSNINSSGMV